MKLQDTKGVWLTRSIKYGQWAATPGFNNDELPADNVGALKTKDNTLSFWEAAGPEADEILEAAIAQIFARDRLDALDIAWLEMEPLTADGVEFESSPGKNKLTEKQGTHVDAVRLDIRRLGAVAGHLALRIRLDGNVRKYTQKDVVEIVASVVKAERIRLTNLPVAWRGPVEEHL